MKIEDFFLEPYTLNNIQNQLDQMLYQKPNMDQLPRIR